MARQKQTVGSDASLAKAAVDGDTPAFSTLVDRHYRTIYALALSRVGDRTAAEDLAQETFLVAYSNLLRLRKPEGFIVWLRRIVRNLSANWIRSEVYRRKLVDRLAQETRGSVAIQGRDQQQEESRERIWDAVHALSPKLRDAVVLYYMEGRSASEAARALGTTENAVYNRLHEARKRLRDILEAEIETELANPPLPTAKKRVMTALALGPAFPEIGRAAANTGVGFWLECLIQANPSPLTNPLIIGGLVVTAKKASIVVALALLMGAGLYFSTRLNPGAPPGTAISESETLPGNTVETPTARSEGPTPRSEPLRAAPSAVVPEPLLPRAETVAKLEEGEISDPSLYCSISGSITDNDWNPISGARVIVIAFGFDRENENANLVHAIRSDKARHFQTTTDHRGRYRVANIRFVKSVLVLAQKEGYVARYARTKAGSPNILLSRGDILENIDIRLSPGITLRGLVLSPLGAPVVDGVVRIMGIGTTQSSREDGLILLGGVGLTYTDRRGRFSLGFISKADYCDLSVTSDTYGVSSFRMVEISDEEVELRMYEPASIIGTITQIDGTPENDKIVTMRGLLRMGHGGIFGSIHAANLDNNGQYEITGIDPGQAYDISLSTLDSRPLTPRVNMPDFTSGETRTWDYVLNDPMMVRGRVLGEFSGKPVRNVQVDCEKDGEQLPSDGNQSGRVRVNDDGTFEFRILTGPGTYSFAANYVGLPYYGSTMITSPSETRSFEGGLERHGTEVELEGGDEIDLDLTVPDPYTIQVRVVDSEGYPVTNAFMQVRMGIGWHGPSGRTDEEGRFSFSGFPPGINGWMDFQSNDAYVNTQTTVHAGQPEEVIPEETLVVSFR